MHCRNAILQIHNQHQRNAYKVIRNSNNTTVNNGGSQTFTVTVTRSSGINSHDVSEFQASCLPSLEWDDELAQVGQVWADQCAMVFYPKTNPFPKIFHEKSGQRTTSRFGYPPGIGQNVAWVLTNKNDTFSDYIKDLWFRDTR